MNPLLAQALGSLIRWLLTIGTPYLVSMGIWTPDEATAYVAGATGALLALGWSLWQKYGARIDFLTALNVPAGTPEGDVTSPSVVRRIMGMVAVIVFVGSMSTACAKVNPALVSAEDAVYQSATRVDDEFRKVCTDQQLTAPCDDARPFVLELIIAARRFNQAVSAQNLDGLTDVIAAGGRLAQKVQALPSGQTVQLAKNIAGAVEAAAKGWK